MHRRPLGQGRTLAALGAIIVVVGCVLPWWRLEPEGGLPPLTGNAFEGSGILVFLAGVVTLALVALPYAVGDRPTSVDRWLSYGLLATLGWFGLAWRIVDLAMTGAFQFDEPTDVVLDGPGIWLAGVGLSILSRAVYRMTAEPAYR